MKIRNGKNRLLIAVLASFAAQAIAAGDAALPADTMSGALPGSSAVIAKAVAKRKVSAEEKALRDVAEKNPDSAAAQASLAAFLLGHSQTEEAISYFQDAIMLDTEQPKYFAALSVAYLHQKRYQMARAMAAEAQRLQPDMAQADKLLEYIDKKEAVLALARKADEAAASTVLSEEAQNNGAVWPNDAIHQPPSTSSEPVSD